VGGVVMAKKQSKKSSPKRSRQNDEIIGGVILIFLGLFFLFSNIYGVSAWYLLATYWPVILIIVGLGIIISQWRNY
jgi:uncharacterized integral membrane protein